MNDVIHLVAELIENATDHPGLAARPAHSCVRAAPPAAAVLPASVARWVNIADHDDFIAAAPDLSALFSAEQPSSAVFEGAWTVDNGAPIGQVLAGL